MSNPRRFGALALLVVPAVPRPTTAQEVTVLTEDLCEACSIELIPDVVLGTDGESVIGLALDIQRLTDGRFVMAFDEVMYEFTVFSPDGSEYRRVGRAGEGPGEYGHVWFVREHGDRLHVFDRRRRRMTVLDHDYGVVGTMPVGCSTCDVWDMALLSDGSAAMNFPTPEGTVHILGEDGKPRLSMEENPPSDWRSRQLGIAPDGSLLVARSFTDYRIDRWDPATGRLLETFLREADWWPDDNLPHVTRPDLPPLTSLTAMHLDEAGRLWLYIRRPAPDWRDHVESTGLPEHRGAWRYGHGAAEWLIELVDMKAGTVIASQVVQVVPPPRAFFFAPGWLAVYDDEDIVPKYRMYRLKLTGLP